MNTKLLQKAIDELKSDKPDLSYLRGMLETLMEMQEVHMPIPGSIMNFQSAASIPNTQSAAEIAASMAESGFVKGTNPGVTQHAPVINNGN